MSREYFYVITLRHGTQTTTLQGTFIPEGRMTRQDAYQQIYSSACDKIGIQGGTTGFFAMEPNKLSFQLFKSKADKLK
jgi:hypothetical protein